MTTTYDTARGVFLRGLGLVYALAFAVALEQNDLLIGSHGLNPGPKYLHKVKGRLEAAHGRPLAQHELYTSLPTLLWLAPEDRFDEWLLRVETTGLVLAMVPLLFGRANMAIMLALWVLYGSVTNDPFAHGPPPKRIRVDKFKYAFVQSWNTSDWWTRSYQEAYLPELAADDPQIETFLRSVGMLL
ncbi:Lipase maturation factor 2 [Hondaea fermentalgiana]|uniref:Lipase maturation factor 2 n=1 Tax=Hondaea fermentalgiana TaxID=2315210 RepID=A0A2R5GP95_9STRA|nr:Lipase maturation factor 2 [Hondaea fermentalgiana]|eukprot:GBG30443.1 Lipase maturation factor 2 [Hondaea fermentalgiana]